MWRAPNGRRLAVGRSDDGAPFAVDDACPHEGYPLSKGALAGRLLTCVWHNFKFDVRSGACVKGDEGVRAWPVREVDGFVEVALAEPDVAEARGRAWSSLEAALRAGRSGAAVRDAVRLHTLGVDPRTLLRWLAAYAANYTEDGLSHVGAVASDAQRLLPRLPGPRCVFAVAQAIDLCVPALARMPRRPVPEPRAPAAFADLQRAVEQERADDAEALVRGALAAGADLRVIQEWLTRLASDHLLAFGHGLIFVVKAFALVDRADPHTADILGGLVFGLVNATREELVPEWAPFRRHVAAIDLDALAAIDGRTPADDALVAAIVGGRRCSEVGAVADALRAGVAPVAIADALIVAASELMLRFDVSIDADPTVQEGWLDVTHRLTYAVAVREVVVGFDGPWRLRLLFLAAHWIARAAPLLGPLPEVTPHPGDVMASVRARDPNAALSALPAALVDAPAALRAALQDYVLDDPWPVPIAAAHLLKTVVAAFDAYDVLPPAWRAHPVAAAARFAACPPAQRFLAGRVHDAIGLVVDGRVPRTLT
jgi:nitrite reductase/ring-hydroxylating ferredoxin subunit